MILLTILAIILGIMITVLALGGALFMIGVGLPFILVFGWIAIDVVIFVLIVKAIFGKK